MSELTNNDYKQILEYYKKQIPKSSRLLKINAEKILAEKLCKCIKKIEPENEARSIGICTKTIFNRKGYTRGKFKCKGKRAVTVTKTIKKRN
jgi:predicted Zn-dependent protease